MNQLSTTYRKVELFFGSLKFAVFIILIFAIALVYGTFMESYHGTEYANRLVYKSFWFMGIQLGMFLSILFATLIRLPLKKNLYGFYVIHAGLIILFIGSFITYQSGIDGTITLAPNLAERQIQLNEDELKILFPSRGKEVSVSLPYTAFSKNLDYEIEGINLKTFLPFAETNLEWIPVKVIDPSQSSSHYQIYNENFGEFFTLSLHPQADFNNTQQMGPLNVHYLPPQLADCFGADSSHGLIVWNAETSGCISPNSKDLKKKKNIKGQSIIEVNFLGEKLSFLPEMSPLPLDQNFNLNEKLPYRIFSKKLFEKNPHLFLFGKQAAFFNKDTQKWETSSFIENSEIALPWMGFRVKLIVNREDAYPALSPRYIKPVQDNGQVIIGNEKAVQIEVNKDKFWVKSNGPVAYNYNGEKITFALSKKALTLPYELVLDQFKMDTDPGTNSPASYESFITLFMGNNGSTHHHVYMNHPLKFKNFTFYQASYFQTNEGPFGSVLSVNFDPGRAWKYLGSLLLVLGSIWHFLIRKKNIKRPGESNA